MSILGFREPTEEEKKQSEEKSRKQNEEWKKTAEEAARLAVPRAIEKLRKEAAGKLAEADKIEAVLKEYPDIRRHVGRWEKVAYYSKSVNSKVERFDMRHNCGCCNDSPLEVWPYLETPVGKIYSDPPMFRVGEKDLWSGGDRPDPGWRDPLKAAGIPEDIIGAISMHFKQCRDEARERADDLYDEDDEDEAG